MSIFVRFKEWGHIGIINGVCTYNYIGSLPSTRETSAMSVFVFLQGYGYTYLFISQREPASFNPQVNSPFLIQGVDGRHSRCVSLTKQERSHTSLLEGCSSQLIQYGAKSMHRRGTMQPGNLTSRICAIPRSKEEAMQDGKSLAA